MYRTKRVFSCRAEIIVMLYTNVEDVFRQLQKSLYSAAGRLMDSLEAGGHRLILEPPIETYTELLPEFIVVQFERLLRSHSKRIESELRIPPFIQDVRVLCINWENDRRSHLLTNDSFSFGALLFPAFKPLVITLIMPRFPTKSPDLDSYKTLDAKLGRLPEHVHVEIEKQHWVYLPKLKSKGVLFVPTTTPEIIYQSVNIDE
ncbi:hypothetical protein ABKN59_009209 [Abortiporus biennis]